MSQNEAVQEAALCYTLLELCLHTDRGVLVSLWPENPGPEARDPQL